MIAFASLFLGLVFGAQTVDLVVGEGVVAVELRLDGEQVAMLRQPPWTTGVDFGPELVPQHLEAIGYDAASREVARAGQWLNLPTEGAALSVVLEPPVAGQPRVAVLSWESTAGAEPKSVRASLDGVSLKVDDPRRLVLPPVDTSELHLLSVEMRFEGIVSSRVDVTFGGAYSDQVNTEMTAFPVWSTGKGRASLAVDKVSDWFRQGEKVLSVVAVEKADAEVVVVMGRAFPRFLGPGERYKPPKSLQLPKDLKLRFLAPRATQSQGVNTQFELFPMSPAYGAETGDVYELLSNLMGPPKKEALQLGSAVAVAGLSAYESRKRRAVVLIPSSLEDSTAGLDIGRAKRYLERLGVPFYVWDPKGSARGDWGQSRKTDSLKSLAAAVDEVREDLDRQWIVWLDGQYAPHTIQMSSQAKGFTSDLSRAAAGGSR